MLVRPSLSSGIVQLDSPLSKQAKRQPIVRQPSEVSPTPAARSESGKFLRGYRNMETSSLAYLAHPFEGDSVFVALENNLVT